MGPVKDESMDINDVTGQVIGAAIEVHKALGPGLLEGIYEDCLCIELKDRNVPFERQKEIAESSVESPDAYPSAPGAHTRNEPPGFLGGHV